LLASVPVVDDHAAASCWPKSALVMTDRGVSVDLDAPDGVH